MATQTLPLEILSEIIKKVGKRSCLDAAPFLFAGTVSRDIFYSHNILHNINITDLCANPQHIMRDARGRKFFKRCLRNGNQTAVFYEAIRIASVGNGLSSAILFLQSKTSLDAETCLLLAILAECSESTELLSEGAQQLVQFYSASLNEALVFNGEQIIRIFGYFNANYEGVFIPYKKHPSFGSCKPTNGVLLQDYAVECNEDGYFFYLCTQLASYV